MTENQENQVAVVEQAALPSAPTSEAVSIIKVIEKAAMNPDVDVDKMERLLQMQERIMARNAETEFNAALAEMQGELPEINEDGKILNKSGNVQSKYATFENINRVVKPTLQKHGFAMSFRTGVSETNMTVVTGVLTHRAGHREETSIHLPLDVSGSKNNVQGVGSSVSYGKRYTMSALLNITTGGEDDDGQTAEPQKTITPMQAQAIINALGGPGERVSNFCKSAKIAKPEDLLAIHFDGAMARIHQSNKKAEAGNA